MCCPVVNCSMGRKCSSKHNHNATYNSAPEITCPTSLARDSELIATVNACDRDVVERRSWPTKPSWHQPCHSEPLSVHVKTSYFASLKADSGDAAGNSMFTD